MNFYNISNVKNVDIDYPDIYFTPEYGICCEESDNAEWELCLYKDLIYVYLKKPITYDNIIYYDLITPYGYSGFYYDNEDTYKKFIPLFRKTAYQRNYVTEVIRQNPYVNIPITNYDIITSKNLFSIEVDDFNKYLTVNLDSKKRNIINKAKKINLKYKIEKAIDISTKKRFIEMYRKTMNHLQASDYYYFNDKYYNKLFKLYELNLASVFDKDGNLVGSAIFFEYKKFIHYHLSCNDRSSNCITDYLITQTLEKLGLGKKLILGSGLKNGDNLSKFKEKYSTKVYPYNIYKNIINKEVYDRLSHGFETTYFPPYRN